MRFGFLFTCCFLSITVSAQLYTGSCKTYIDQPVTFEAALARFRAPVTGNDSSVPPVWGIRCPAGSLPGYYLKSADSAFRIISYTISAETTEGDILEAIFNGENSMPWHVSRVYMQAAPGTDVYFYCIRAVHTNGKEYTLKPFSVKK